MNEEESATPLEVAADTEGRAEDTDLSQTGVPVSVYLAESPEDGEIVRGLLESEGIPVIYTHSASPIFGQIFSPSVGQVGEIFVAPADVERALSILALSTEDGLSGEDQPSEE
jgi:hypothetical protein